MDRLLIKNTPTSVPTGVPVLAGATIVGRHPYCDVVLNNNAVSREHAKISRGADGAFYLEDLQSRNGTWLNEKKITEPTRIYSQDSIQIGDATLLFCSDSPEAIRKPNSRFKAPQDSLCWGDCDCARPNITSQITLNNASSFCDGAALGRRSVREYEREIRLLEERVRILLDFARILGKADDVTDLTPRFLTSLLRLFPEADSACVLAPSPEESTPKRPVLKLVNYKRRNEEVDEPFHVSRSIIRHVVSTRAGVISDSASDDSRFDSSESIVQYRILSVMAAPIVDASTDRLIGVIQIDARKNGRQFEQDELKLLVAVANQVAVYIENQNYRDDFLQKKMASREMQVANQVQRGFLPVEPPKVENYEFYDYYNPAKFVGGDYFDYIILPDDKIAIVLGDVSGKGISASLLMAKLSSEARYGLLLEKSYAAAMARLNRVYSENHWGDRFITLVMMILETKTGTIRFFNAGHLYPLVAKTDGTVAEIGEGFNSFPLGIVPEAEYPECVYSLQEGEAIALMSDGLTDAQNGSDEAFDLKRVVENLRNPDGLDAGRLGQRLIASVQQFSGSTQQTDDQCLVVFRRKSASESTSNSTDGKLSTTIATAN